MVVKINFVFNPETYNLKEIINVLNKQYLKQKHSFEIRQVAGGFQMVSKEKYEVFNNSYQDISNYILDKS